MMKYIFLFISIASIICCKRKVVFKDSLPVSNEVAITQIQTSDTLRIGYTYWWPQSGPFVGNCGTPYALACIGTVTHLGVSKQQGGQQYTTQEGVISIDKVLAVAQLAKTKYTGQRYLTTDSFEGTAVQEGDTVLVFCYAYEGSYVTPGRKSILKISGNTGPAITSITTYINASQKAVAIQEDIAIWEQHGVANDLLQLIVCERETDPTK